MSSNISQAEIVVIGGGAVGCAVAYSLAMAGKTNVLLLEKEPNLAAVTTPQAAGLVGQVRNSIERTKLAMWSVKTFSQLERDEQAKPGWRQVGSLRIALCDERVEEFHGMKQVADKSGLEVDFIDQRTAKQKWPSMSFERAKAILWCPSDGYLQPSDLTMAYVAHARRRGVQFQTNCPVRQVIVKDGRVTGVETDAGTIACGMVINAAGAHAYHIARGVGLELPIVPVRHEYFVTVHCDGLNPNLPVVRIPDTTLYLRAEMNSLLCGGWEPSGLSEDPRTFSLETTPPPIDPDWDVLGWFAQQLAPEIPQVEQLGIRSVFKGWPTFTPDGRFIIGESSRVKGFVMAGGCNAHGVSGSAGIGRHVVESILEPDPSPYVKSLSPNRFERGWDWTAPGAKLSTITRRITTSGIELQIGSKQFLLDINLRPEPATPPFYSERGCKSLSIDGVRPDTGKKSRHFDVMICSAARRVPPVTAIRTLAPFNVWSNSHLSACPSRARSIV